MENHVQALVRGADRTTRAFFLDQTTLVRTLPSRGERFRMFRLPEQSAETFARQADKYRQLFHAEILGRMEDPLLPPNPPTRQIYDRPK